MPRLRPGGRRGGDRDRRPPTRARARRGCGSSSCRREARPLEPSSMRSSACSIAPSESPAEPKTPRNPPRAIASTISTEPIPLAIAPDMHGNRTPWRARNCGSPRSSRRQPGMTATTCAPSSSVGRSLGHDLVPARAFDDAKRLADAGERALESLSIGRGHNHGGAPQSVSSFSVAGVIYQFAGLLHLRLGSLLLRMNTVATGPAAPAETGNGAPG